MSGGIPWPDYALPAPPLNEGYKITLPDLLSRSDFEQGPARQINVFFGGPTQYAITWPMTPEQFALYLGFRRHALADGNAWIDIPVFDGADYTTRTIRFVKGPHEPSRQSGEWMVSATYETMEDVAPSELDTAVALLTWGADQSLEDIANLFDTIIHGVFREAMTP